MQFLVCFIALLACPALAFDEGRALSRIEALQADGSFSRQAAEELRDYFSSTRPAAIRARAAHVFYLLFYDLRGVEAQAVGYLLEEPVKAEFARGLSAAEPDASVRRALAQTGQVMTLTVSAAGRDALVAAYAPIFLAALKDPSAAQRHELLAALENFAASSAFRRAGAALALRAAAAREADEDLRARTLDLLSMLQKEIR